MERSHCTVPGGGVWEDENAKTESTVPTWGVFRNKCESILVSFRDGQWTTDVVNERAASNECTNADDCRVAMLSTAALAELVTRSWTLVHM